ncbi:hypothetical protein J2S13_000944 [Oikeobacillus pervagus]|uniref:Uncharacterized protein n=1 Tax=Oikeobacillus pervagus TaxID=1325931 RepID=A0AAJ1WIL3_9BACI|nr:hypothetical protein [Oikeobacillus pervagus]MDQ0214548.1 hypothetical protein [Oikeobacillus pervagus]
MKKALLIPPSEATYAVTDQKGKITAICLKGMTKKLCSYQKGNATIEGPVPIRKLIKENITDN